MVREVETVGEQIVNVVQGIINDVTLNLPADGGEDGEATIVPWPETLVWGDDSRKSLLESEVYKEWEVHLPDLTARMAKEGVLLMLGIAGDLGLAPTDDLFNVLADIAASMYARGYMIGLLEGPDGAPADEPMDKYLAAVRIDIDRQVEEMGGLLTIFDDETGETE